MGQFLTPTEHCKASDTISICLLKTAVAPITAGSIRTQANILFDDGAQRSFISLALSNELQITTEQKTDIYSSSLLWYHNINTTETWNCHCGNRDNVW